MSQARSSKARQAQAEYLAACAAYAKTPKHKQPELLRQIRAMQQAIELSELGSSKGPDVTKYMSGVAEENREPETQSE
jgi:hypothetical protein